MDKKHEVAEQATARTTIRLPVWLLDEFRRDAFFSRRSINELMVETLAKKYANGQRDESTHEQARAAA